MSQSQQIARVAENIGDVVLQFCQKTIGRDFHAQELRDYVTTYPDTSLVAPASPDRILRMLRQQGRVSYEVVNRRQSLYRVLAVAA